jgi:hypothetical protein
MSSTLLIVCRKQGYTVVFTAAAKASLSHGAMKKVLDSIGLIKSMEGHFDYGLFLRRCLAEDRVSLY